MDRLTIHVANEFHSECQQRHLTLYTPYWLINESCLQLCLKSKGTSLPSDVLFSCVIRIKSSYNSCTQGLWGLNLYHVPLHRCPWQCSTETCSSPFPPREPYGLARSLYLRLVLRAASRSLCRNRYAQIGSPAPMPPPVSLVFIRFTLYESPCAGD
jgi:hypothetical protein